ncbi:MAG: hypothetical protein JWP44_3771 [Mucilaginibacter sp.]|nr:hypothetical protein [Mucilaginibacter sp.]
MDIFIIEDLKFFADQFSPIHCDFLAENCIVALEKHGHASGCEVALVNEAQAEQFAVAWSKGVIEAGYKESTKITERAAEAVGFYLSRRNTSYHILEEAIIGTGIDYWLGYDENHVLYDERNFLKARLEISGIDEETPSNNLKRRIGEKKEQTAKSDDLGIPAYIAVIEFSTPKAYFGKK